MASRELKKPAGCARPTEGAAEGALDRQGWELGAGGKIGVSGRIVRTLFAGNGIIAQTVKI